MVGLKHRDDNRRTHREKDRLDDNKDESWFKIRYRVILWTSQISIVPMEYPFHDCSGGNAKVS